MRTMEKKVSKVMRKELREQCKVTLDDFRRQKFRKRLRIAWSILVGVKTKPRWVSQKK